MSDIVKIVFYYGLGSVRSNEMGVDLSEFKSVEMDLTGPRTWTIEQVKDWLIECFRLNPEVHTVGVHALWTKSLSNIF
jgi:hypothetical protein